MPLVLTLISRYMNYPRTKVTSQRIEMMNKLNSTRAKVNIIDLKDGQVNATGTKVELNIPV
jgi:hypothetical protein